MIITVDQVISWEPCNRYGETEEKIRECLLKISGGRESITILEAFDLPIPPQDIQWLVLRKEVISSEILHEFAYWCKEAEQALLAERNAGQEPYPDSWKAIKWLKGEVTDRDARAAASDAARAAVWFAAKAVDTVIAAQNAKLKELIEAEGRNKE